MPILWLPRRCVFDGFLQEFEGFKGYVRPLSGRLSLAGWAGILLGLCRFACVPTTGTSMLLAVSKACLGTSSAATLATPWAGTLLGLCRFACVPMLYLHAFSGFEGAVWAPVCRQGAVWAPRLQPHWPPPWAGILLGLCRFACVPTTTTSMLLAVSKACLGICLQPQLATPWAFCAFAFRVLPFESVSSRPDGSFSCRFCGFQGGAFSMASYRSLRGSKGTLGLCRAVCLWRVGLESCWGSAVSHACPPPVPPHAFSGFEGAVWAPSTCLPPQLATPWAGILLSALSLFESYRLKVFPAVRTGAFRADFVASKKVRFRWLPTGV